MTTIYKIFNKFSLPSKRDLPHTISLVDRLLNKLDIIKTIKITNICEVCYI